MKQISPLLKANGAIAQPTLMSEFFKDSNIFNFLPCAAYVADASGVIVKYNQKAVELWGRVPKNGDKVDLYCKRVVEKQDLSEKISSPRSLAEAPPSENIEMVIERPGSSRISVKVTVAPIKNNEGIILGTINCMSEISDQKKTEKERGWSTRELPYRQLVHNLNVAIYTTDSHGRITLYNQAAADLWGREPEIGKDLWCGSYKIFRPDGSELPLDTCPMALCLKEGRPIYGEEILVVRPDGSLRNVAPHPQPFFDESGNMAGAINMLVDVTDIKSTEKALLESETKYRDLTTTLQKIVADKTIDLQKKNLELKRSEERYHKMIEEVEDYAIILLDQNGIIQNWNKGAEKIKGYKEEEIVGKSFSNFYFTEDREAGIPFKLLGEAKHNGKAIHEGWRRRKDGSRFWGSIVLTSLHDDQNNIIGYSKVTRDLTERKLSEDRLREYTDQLEFQNKELEQFAYAASHDMKEPIRKIHLYNSFISENPANLLDEQSREYLARSINAVKRMSDLIEDLLTYSKTTANIHSLDKVDLNEVVEEIKLMHKEEFEQKKVQIKTENLPTINAIPFQIKQLMFNLINNSIKYKHAERNALIEIRGQYISASEMNEAEAELHKDYQRISVIDNGLGFDPQHAEKIFKIFQRLTHHTTTEGSGIGLAICKKIVQNHRGFITATGKENEGARFDIYFPADL